MMARRTERPAVVLRSTVDEGSLMSSREAVIALRRFGLGTRPGDLERVGNDPRGFLLASIGRGRGTLPDETGLDPSYTVFEAAHQATMQVRLARAFREDGGKLLKSGKDAEANGATPAAPTPPAAPAMPAGEEPDMAKAKPAVPDKPQQIRREALRREMAARMDHARQTDDAFIERLVMFWSNHFCVNASKGAVLGIAGAFEREAIRPHVLGRFADMLLAVEHHPAMLIYLDNQASTGPNSKVGINRNRGLNENLAREILELHTLGVDGGYTQTDVTSFARLLTGWGVGFPNQQNVEPGRFHFAANRHEPGVSTVLGKRYGEGGVAAGRRCLQDLARHPSTARHIARKLAVHFVADAPPAELVAKLETTFRNSDGDLVAVSRALVTSEQAWTAPPRKVLPPYDFIIALQRAFGLDQLPLQERVRLMTVLGQPLWRPPSPAGWPDADEAFASPSGMRERLRVVERIAPRVAQRGDDPRSLAESLLGDVLSQETRQAIARAEAREQAVALLVMSPEFQRR